MSQLIVDNAKYGSRNLNVTSFSAPISGTISTVQLKKMQHHFPIRTIQAELELQLMFASIEDFVDFQTYIRNVQLDALNGGKGLSISFDIRNMSGFTGFPNSIVVGAQRFLYAPRCQLNLTLVDSMISQGSATASTASDFAAIYGVGSPDGVQTQTVDTSTSSYFQTGS